MACNQLRRSCSMGGFHAKCRVPFLTAFGVQGLSKLPSKPGDCPASGNLGLEVSRRLELPRVFGRRDLQLMHQTRSCPGYTNPKLKHIGLNVLFQHVLGRPHWKFLVENPTRNLPFGDDGYHPLC